MFKDLPPKRRQPLEPPPQTNKRPQPKWMTEAHPLTTRRIKTLLDKKRKDKSLGN